LKPECAVESTFGREGKEVAGGRAAIDNTGIPRTGTLLLAVAVEVVSLRLGVAADAVVADTEEPIDTAATAGGDKEVAVSEEVPDTVEADWPHGG
jgi:hypothetical protein